MTGIYKIRNIKNDKVYVGSSKNIEKRWLKHLSELRLNRHPSKKLQSAYNLFGEDSFVLELIEACNVEDLIPKEMQYITEFNSIRDGYNTLLGRKWDVSYLREIEPDNGIIKNKYRIRTDEEIFYIKAIQFVFGPVQRPLAAIFNTTPSSINYYYNNLRYKDVCDKFNAMSLFDKVKWFQAGIDYTDFSASLISAYNNVTAQLVWIFIEEFPCTSREEIAAFFYRSVSGIDKIRSRDSFPEAKEEAQKLDPLERKAKLYCYIYHLISNGQSVAKEYLDWYSTFNDYLEREYTISD